MVTVDMGLSLEMSLKGIAGKIAEGLPTICQLIPLYMRNQLVTAQGRNNTQSKQLEKRNQHQIKHLK